MARTAIFTYVGTIAAFIFFLLLLINGAFAFLHPNYRIYRFANKQSTNKIKSIVLMESMDNITDPSILDVFYQRSRCRLGSPEGKNTYFQVEVIFEDGHRSTCSIVRESPNGEIYLAVDDWPFDGEFCLWSRIPFDQTQSSYCQLTDVLDQIPRKR